MIKLWKFMFEPLEPPITREAWIEFYHTALVFVTVPAVFVLIDVLIYALR